ncbi:glutaredoxin family protein [Agaribacterium sp. ZY112]|uniref:glutaredoxin family protein n=1 Tax=Agaribacterium sp. ZY112 TaxID=3233574 RepID=UPI0035261555
MVKLFFKALRAILGPLLLLADKLLPPKKLASNSLNQTALEQKAGSLTLYQFASCPFCIKVRRHAKRLGLKLETRNVLKNQAWHKELEEEGGKRKVPCLRISDEHGDTRWLYDSKAIKAYLSQEFVL